MPNKNAQITLIFAIAISILIIAAFIFYAAGYYKNRAPLKPPVFEKASIENYINGCVKKTAEEGLKQLGKQGGLITIGGYLTVPNTGIVYLYNNGNRLPSMEKMQNELSFYINKKLNDCLKDFKDFKKQGWDVENGRVGAKTVVNEEDVYFEVNFQIKVSDKGRSISFERFVHKSDVRLKHIYGLVSRIVSFRENYNRAIDMKELGKYDVNITVMDNENALIYVIRDSKSRVRDKPYTFVFGMA